jgi:hypothetical protein
MCNVFRTEYYPTDDCRHERQQHLQKFYRGWKQTTCRHYVCMPAILSQQHEREKEQGMISAPKYKRPISSVPKAAYKKYYHGVAERFSLTASASSKRDVNIVSKPCRQGYMPPSPELGNVSREIREVEVSHQAYAKQPRRAYGYV